MTGPDLDATWELPLAAVWPRGVSPVAQLPPPVRPPPTHRDPVAQAALALMAEGHDRLAILCTLADQYPGRCIKEVDRVVRETAVTLVAAGLIPAGHTPARV